MSEWKPPTIDELNNWGVRFVLAIRHSISFDKIKPIDWPSRIVAALETGAVSDHFSGMISSVARKLQASPLHGRTASELRALEAEIATTGAYEDFRRHVEREASYLEAMAREDAKAIRDAAGVLHKADAADDDRDYYTIGRDAFVNHGDMTNPYPAGSRQAHEWARGNSAAQEASK